MAKECPVIINNDCVTVVRYDGIDIQFPSVGKDAKSVFVTKHSNGSYHITDSIEAETVDADFEQPKTNIEQSGKARMKKQSKHYFKKKENSFE